MFSCHHPLKLFPSRAHFARNEGINSAATLHHTQHKVQHQIYIRNAALDWQQKPFQHSAAVWWQSHTTDGAQVAEAGTFSVFRATLRRDTNPHEPGPAHLGPSQPNSAVKHQRGQHCLLHTNCRGWGTKFLPTGHSQPGVKHLLLGQEPSARLLWLTNTLPVAAAAENRGKRGLVCRQSLHHQTPQLLSPDTHSCSCSCCQHQWADEQTQKQDRKWY